MSPVPSLRIHAVNRAAPHPDGAYVVYWMIAQRRGAWNFALDRAIEWAHQLRRPLIVLEALRLGYPWASVRLHRFVLQGMVDNAAYWHGSPVHYYPYLETQPNAGRGLLEALAAQAAVVVTDDFPSFFLPRMVAAAGSRLPVLLEAVDSNGILPLRAADQVFPTAFAFRRFLQRELPKYLAESPAADPKRNLQLPPAPALPRDLLARWPVVDPALALASGVLDRLPIDQSVGPASFAGGSQAAQVALDRFVRDKLADYAQQRNEPEQDATTGMSPYLHFGHVSVHEIFHRVTQHENWTPTRLAAKASGSRAGWWGMDENAEALLDQLITWRELGYNMAWQQPDYDRYESLPPWARTTLDQHEQDERPHLYTLPQLEQALTHDPLWNAAQTQLLREGRMHNYLRMLWGKKILQWSPTPRDALAAMIELNNKYAVDGRNPNSYSGIFWCLGRYDRPWGPERPIFGKIRYMTSENTARKLDVAEYLRKYAPAH